MSPLFRNLALAAVALGAATWAVARLGLFDPAPAPLATDAETVARGTRVFANKCLHCHRDIPLGRRVAGWSVERAYETIGRLPEVSPSMPAFHGSDDERRALAAFLSTLGAGERR